MGDVQAGGGGEGWLGCTQAVKQPLSEGQRAGGPLAGLAASGGRKRSEEWFESTTKYKIAWLIGYQHVCGCDVTAMLTEKDRRQNIIGKPLRR